MQLPHMGRLVGLPTGRSLSLLDPTYASKYIPIIASVSEHQPPAWPSYFTDLNLLVRGCCSPAVAAARQFCALAS